MATPQEMVLFAGDKINRFLNWAPFNTLLLTCSAAHMIIIAMNDCHGPQGEASSFCGKGWEQCKFRANATDYFDDMGANFTCGLRLCLAPNCKVQNVEWDKRPLYADVLALANFYFRWGYTGITCARMVGRGLFLSKNPFFLNGWNIMDILVVIAAWLDTPLKFGNLMFFMVLRGFKLLMESSHPYLAVPRVQMKALGMGLFKIALIFLLLNFIMAFIGLLGISLVGSKGDFHNRCAVPLVTNPGTDRATFTYEPIVPEITCRQDHLFSTNVVSCYGDVWAAYQTNFTPTSLQNGSNTFRGCRGTCGNSIFLEKMGTQEVVTPLKVTGKGLFNKTVQADGVFCIGPQYQPLDKAKFPPVPLGGTDLKDYIAADVKEWPSAQNNDMRNWDSIGNAATVMYTVFYRSSWVSAMQSTTQSAGDFVVIGWIVMMIFTSYYLLNITVSITCNYYSEATVAEAEMVEAKKLADRDPTLKDNEEEEEEEEGDGGDDEDEDEQDLGGFEEEGLLPRDVIYREMQADSYPDVGHGCDCLIFCCQGVCLAWGKISAYCLAKYSFLNILTNPCTKVYTSCSKVFRTCCHACIRAAARCTFEGSGPEQEDEEEEELLPDGEGAEKGGRKSFIALRIARAKLSLEKLSTILSDRFIKGAPMATTSVVCMIGCMITQGLQNAEIINYKCDCTDDEIKNSYNLTALPMCDATGACLDPKTNQSTATTCIADRCIPNAQSHGYPCIDPQYNPYFAELNKRLGLDEVPQPSSLEWQAGRAQWCTFGSTLHLALYGFAFIFLLELATRYIAHQGVGRFFTMELHDPKHGKRRPNVMNIVDTVSILATVVGIVITEISFSPNQVLLANVSYQDPLARSGQGVPWVVKVLRLATLIRLAIRAPNLSNIPMVAVILRGFRGAEKVLFGIVVLIIMVFFFGLLGKELFDWGYSNMRKKFVEQSDFSDIGTSMVPLLEIMVGSGWYEYLKAGTDSLGIIGFLYFALYFFIVNFQFLRIFIAIIVQNYELSEEEKVDAQRVILEQNFARAEVDADPERKAKYTGSHWTERFSFTRHYFELLRGAQINLRMLEQNKMRMQEDNGLTRENEDYLEGDMYEDTSDEDAEIGVEKDEADIMLENIQKVKLSLSINPMDKLRKAGGDDDDDDPSMWQLVRAKLRVIVKHDTFNFVVMVMVLVSTVFAVVTTFPDSLQSLMSLVFLGFFTTEMVLKIIAYGFFNKVYPGYFRRGWCILDFVLVCLQILDVLFDTFPDVFNMGAAGDIFKGFRAIRIARLLARLQNIRPESNPLKVILLALGASLPPVLMLLIAVIFMMFVFGLFGMDQFMGLLSLCTTEDAIAQTGRPCIDDTYCFPGYVGQCLYNGVGTFAYCKMDKMHCFGERSDHVPSAYQQTHWKSVTATDAFTFPIPRVWKAPTLNFDNLLNTLYAMFCLINRSGIRELFISLAALTQRDMGPLEGANRAATAYLIVLILIVGIFVSQVVVGIIMTNLRLKTGLAFHTQEQLVWPATKDAFDFMPSPYVASKGGGAGLEGSPLSKLMMMIRMKFQGIAGSWKFALLMQLTVAFNCSLLAVLYFDMPGDLQVIYFWGGFACFVIYCFEFLVRIIADPIPYIMNPADQFDIFLTLLNAFDLFIAPQLGIDLGLSSLRMFRLFRLLTRIETFVGLLETIVKSAPQAMASVVLTFIVIFIFAAVGTRMFTWVKEGTELDTTFNNFSNFLKSLIAMFRVSSGANWSTVLAEAGIGAPYCTPQYWTPVDVNSTAYKGTSKAAKLDSFGTWTNNDVGFVSAGMVSDCGIGIGALAFFLIFVFINNYVILPTFVASIISSYYEANLKEHSLISKQELHDYRDCWLEVVSGTKGGDPGQMRFERNPDKTQKERTPYLLDRFDNLISILDMRGCRLGFSKTRDSEKYKSAMARLKTKMPEKTNSNFRVGYRQMAVLLLSIAEKSRPVTIVDILRRQRAQELLVRESQKPQLRQKKQEVGKLHAGINLPSESSKKTGLLQPAEITYSYNVYVVLDQLARLDADKDRISEEQHEGLKKLCLDNDEDIFVYFEEYVEKSGPVYQNKINEAYKAFVRFGRKAKDVYARSKYGNQKKKAAQKGGGDGGKANDDDDDESEEEEEEEEEVLEQTANAEDAAEDAGVDGMDAEDAYGKVIKDADGVLDLRNWTMCGECGEPVDRNWDRCPNCNSQIAAEYRNAPKPQSVAMSKTSSKRSAPGGPDQTPKEKESEEEEEE